MIALGWWDYSASAGGGLSFAAGIDYLGRAAAGKAAGLDWNGDGVLIVVLMGVSGSGKTTVGRLLAQELGWEFYEGDQYHPPENIAKMSSGIPLGDADRWPWLRRLRDLIAGLEAGGGSAVIACSALKQSYRDLLGETGAAVTFVYLKGGGELIGQRLAGREGHFMPTSLLDSQFADLEEPQNAITAEVDRPPEAIAAQLRAALRGE